MLREEVTLGMDISSGTSQDDGKERNLWKVILFFAFVCLQAPRSVVDQQQQQPVTIV